MAVEGSAEAMDEAHRPEAGLRAGDAALAQMGLDDVQLHALRQRCVQEQ